MDLLLYHYPCPDGAFAGLCAWLRLAADGRAVRAVPQAIFAPATPAERAARVPSFVGPGDTVHLLDFSGGAAHVLALCAAARRVVLVDHHKTAAEDLAALAAGGALPANLEVHMDMARSGASLARDVYDVAPLLAARLGGEGAARVLRLVAYVEDDDLWRHALPGSRAFTAGLAGLRLDYDAVANPGLWEALLALDPDALIASGGAELARREAVVAAEAAAAVRVAIPPGGEAGGAGGEGGGPPPPPLLCLGVLSAHPELRSELGNALSRRAAGEGLPPAGAVAYVEPGMAGGRAAAGWLKVSLRSVGAVDTSALSRSHGGGGHANASSFNAPPGAWEAWVEAGREAGGEGARKDGGAAAAEVGVGAP